MFLTLPKPLQDLWSQYRRLEEPFSFRSEAITALQIFIKALLDSPENIWRPWALSVAAEFVDRGGYLIRDQLFEQVLFPALLDGLDNNEPGCARWLGAMAQHLYRCPECLRRLGPERSYGEALFRLALAKDPTDAGARRGLIKIISGHFSYSLHEQPSGVLFDTNGATPLQCGQLRSELSEFEILIATEGCAAAYAGLVEKCRFHFTAYEQYLAGRPRCPSYAEFIAKSGGGPVAG